MKSHRPVVLPGRVSHRGNVTPASSGRVDGPAACRARRGPDGVRGVVDFCDPAKIHDSPGLPTGGTLSAGVRPTKNVFADDSVGAASPTAKDAHKTKTDRPQACLSALWSIGESNS